MLLLKFVIFGVLFLFSLLFTFAIINQMLLNAGWIAKDGLKRHKVRWSPAAVLWTATVLYLLWVTKCFI